MSRKLPLLVLIGLLGACAIALFAGYLFYQNFTRASQISNSQSSIPNPLATISFPDEAVQYPADWPEELKYPKDFILVDTASGSYSEDTPVAYSAQLRYRGTPSQALAAMVAFLQENGWSVLDSTTSNSGNASLIVERAQGSGLIGFNIDSNDSNQTLITATIFPQK
jgi:hypothetical protein